jgi:hypothetical protein
MLMSMAGAAMVGLLIGIPQAIGLGVSRLVSNRNLRFWLGPVAAGTVFALGWWFWGAAPVRDAAAHGERTCGAAGALLIVPLLFITPANVVVGLLLQGLFNAFGSHRRRSLADKASNVRP